jgi:hypothetical protein
VDAVCLSALDISTSKVVGYRFFEKVTVDLENAFLTLSPIC